MLIIESYIVAVILLFITMICWGSWANTQKLASKNWPFQLFYWDYTIGIVLISLLFGITIGSSGEEGRSFFEDLGQAAPEALGYALLGGVVFNIANLLIVAAIDIAGMAVAFPVGIGLALVVGVLINYIAVPIGDPFLLSLGVGFVTVAIVLDAVAYRKKSQDKSVSVKGLWISIIGGLLMGFFFRFVAASVATDYANPQAGLMTPYSAVFVFAIGIFLSNFIWNTFFMYKPLKGDKVTYREYFFKGRPKLHLIGILGGAIWCIGMSFSLIASEQAGFAISYGLGQGATMIAAAWGVFIWKEFEGAPKGIYYLIYAMFVFFLLGLALLIIARL
jgi:glucose uptake protein